MISKLSDKDKLTLCDAASILRSESRNYYDHYKRAADSESKIIRDAGNRSYEKYNELQTIARELDIIIGGL